MWQHAQHRVAGMFKAAAQSQPVRALAAFTRNRPFLASGCTSSVFLVIADVSTQRMTAPQDPLDHRRVLSMFTWGLLWYGGPQQMYWTKLYPWLFGRGTISSAMKTTGADCIVNPLVTYVPCFYMLTGAVKGQSIDESIAVLRKEYLVTCFGFICYWMPVQFINFYFMPPHMVTYVVSVANIVHKMWLSWLSNRGQNEDIQTKASNQQRLDTDWIGLNGVVSATLVTQSIASLEVVSQPAKAVSVVAASGV